jgi:glycosyltransferase involved in cell wall biosynthesis
MTALLARIVIFVIVSGAIVSTHLLRAVRRVFGGRVNRHAGELRVLVSCTFNNDNWFRSHVLPLSRCDAIERVYLVCDTRGPAVQRVEYVCPPRWLARIIGRLPTRLIYVMSVAVRRSPDWCIGYHIMPNALFCLMAAAAAGGKTVYQMTGGPVQIIGGGCGSENPMLRRLRSPSPVLERLMTRAARLFDVIVVRGGQAAEFLNQRHIAQRVAIIPGSVDVNRFQPGDDEPRYDLIMVARLIPQKQPLRFLAIVDTLRRTTPALRAALIGSGPLADEVREKAERLHLGASLECLGEVSNVDALLRQSRVFVLTSSSEGLSIAMMEAMAAGLPVAVPDVGELSDMVRDGENGLLIDPVDAEQTASRLAAILTDEARYAEMSRAARSAAVRRVSIDAVAELWRRCLSPNAEAHADVSTQPSSAGASS